MKREAFTTGMVFFLMFSSVPSAFAQRGPGGGPGGFDPGEMVKREKQNLYKSLDDLSDDQKLLLDGIYDEFAVSIGELRDEMRQTRNFQEMRPKMMALREEKDGLIRDVLSEEQYQVYQGLMENRRKQMEEYRQQRGNAGNRPAAPPSDGTSPDDQSN